MAIKYKELNVNPKNRKTGDCSTRALVSVLGISYQEALRLQYKEALECYYDTSSKQVVERILKKYGYVKMKQPRKPNGTKYCVEELDELVDKATRDKGVLVTVANHHTCVKGDYIVDIWNCGYKTIGNYYIKTT